MKNIVITGGAGFIGSHVVRLFVNKYPEYKIINLDALTYAGNLANLRDIEDNPNYKFVKMDICDFDAFYKLMQDEQIDGIIHLAAESHVDRSIKDPFIFARTNVMGTLSLLQAAKLYWESLPDKYEGKRFYHISTDEVYGALTMNHPEGIEPPFTTTASSFSNAFTLVGSLIHSSALIRSPKEVCRFFTKVTIRSFAAAEKYFSTYICPTTSPRTASTVLTERFQRGCISFLPDIVLL